VYARKSAQARLVIIRAWVEDGSSEPLRAHIRISNDLASDFDREVTLTQPEAVCSMLREWLVDMLNGSEQQHD
jgi:hypothetical protein